MHDKIALGNNTSNKYNSKWYLISVSSYDLMEILIGTSDRDTIITKNNAYNIYFNPLLMTVGFCIVEMLKLESILESVLSTNYCVIIALFLLNLYINSFYIFFLEFIFIYLLKLLLLNNRDIYNYYLSILIVSILFFSNLFIFI